GVLPGATEEQAEAFTKKMRADSDAAITDPRQVRPVFHWHDVPVMKAGDWSYHPCTNILIEGLKRLEGGSDVLAEWNRARAKADAALAQQPAADCTCPHQDAREPDHDVACPARLAQQPAAVDGSDAQSAEIETLLAELDIRDSIIATHAADTREYQKRISQAKARADKLAEALRNSADALERLAFAIRAPNAHTPQLVELAIAMRAAALRGQEESH